MQVYGIDLSKEKFDVNFKDLDGKEKRQQVKNKVVSISKFLHTLPCEAVLVAEHTGAYGDLLVYLSNQLNINIALVSGYTIKHSLGLVKGKSDPIDARRIREYGERFFDKLKFKVYDDETIVELKTLYSLRAQLVKARKSLRTGEHGRSQVPMQSIAANKHIKNSLLALDNEIDSLDDEIEHLIKANKATRENYELTISVIGIGPVIGTDLIIKTGNFQIIDTAKKASSYAGVCPFSNTSGKMVGKSKTSPFADKKLKSLLYMGAKSAVKHNQEYRLYYQKKKLEGKPHYLIMNNVSNKILRTIYSVVKSKKPYRQDFICRDPREKNINSSHEKVA
ncbi:transposase [Carboxylicivirga marina]|uniref:Transposase n=1 Tax=Carboxylicivirga marina TaxID=2800988 RepID=A0ABS1HR25_9BACT|nr:transposase [Carboxylicivirga marina]MBK3520046.1 transposase [Carboxylicivirga marina]